MPDFTETHRIVNLRYKIDNYNFDAAIDISYYLHGYSNIKEKVLTVPIEIYNLDEPGWDIKLIYCNSQHLNDVKYVNEPDSPICHTFVSVDFIIEETKKWIEENK